MKLVAMNAPSYFELVIVQDDVVIGKKQELVDLVIPFNKMISRKHCRVTKMNGTYYISDEGSANGTYVNGVRLNPGQRMQINRGDVIRLADSDFQIV
jgi:pSer/pThr/pTyr-binding forkhead associated (FHA) protein